MWAIDPEFLDAYRIDNWQNEIDASRGNSPSIPDLPDYGKSYEEKVTRGRKYFVKFFGNNQHRVGLDFDSRTEIEDAHCHYTLSFSRKNDDRRPRKYRDGDVVFMAMMLHGNDYAIFGKGICYSHNDQRDVATPEDIRHVPWRDQWPILIRVHSTEFIDSNMRNCPKLMDLIHDLDYESFQSTLRRYYSEKITYAKS